MSKITTPNPLSSRFPLHAKMKKAAGVCVALLCTLAFDTQANLIAHYDFTDGNLLDNEAGSSYTLSETGSGVSLDPSGFASFPGDDTIQSYLETPGAVPIGSDFIVSFWWKTDSFEQGDFQGLFSSNTANVNYSWQFDSSGTDMRLVSNGSSANPALSDPESNLAPDTWYHTVVRKWSENNTDLYITQEGAVSPLLVGSQGRNPGGLNFFRLGVNRNTDSLFRFDMANVKIYDDSTQSRVSTLLAEGPGLIPEPGTFALLAIGVGLLAAVRWRQCCK